MTKETLRIGAPSYINALPFFYPLIHKKVLSDATFIFDHPAKINALLKNKELDIALISSAHFIDHQDLYTMIEGYGIAAYDEVMSVCLFAKKGKKREEWRHVALPTVSETSTRLVHLLMQNFWNIHPQVHRFGPATSMTELQKFDAFLLIGDICLQHLDMEWFERIDLAQAWHEATKTGMIFALFATHHQDRDTSSFREMLKESLLFSSTHMDEIIQVGKERLNISSEILTRYYSRLHYSLQRVHLQGLQLVKEIIS